MLLASHFTLILLTLSRSSRWSSAWCFAAASGTALFTETEGQDITFKTSAKKNCFISTISYFVLYLPLFPNVVTLSSSWGLRTIFMHFFVQMLQWNHQQLVCYCLCCSWQRLVVICSYSSRLANTVHYHMKNCYIYLLVVFCVNFGSTAIAIG